MYAPVIDRNTGEAWPAQQLPYQAAIKAEYLFQDEEALYE